MACENKCRIGILIFLSVLAVGLIIVLILAAVGVFNTNTTEEVPAVQNPDVSDIETT